MSDANKQSAHVNRADVQRVGAMAAAASALAHAVGTPLNVILGRASMIEAVPNKAAKHAAIIAEQARALADTIQLVLNAIDGGAGSEVRQANLRTVVAAALAEAAPDWHDGVAVPDVMGTLDSFHLHAAITNMVRVVGREVTITGALRTFDAPPDPTCSPGSYFELVFSGAEFASAGRASEVLFSGSASPSELALVVASKCARRAGGAVIHDERGWVVVLPCEPA